MSNQVSKRARVGFGLAMAVGMTAGLMARGARADGPATMPATAPTAGVDNPQYGLWSKYKVGSSAAMAGDLDLGGPAGKAHIEMTQTLKALTPEMATVEIAQKVTVMGHLQVVPSQTQAYPAKEPKEDSVQTGTQDVTAMGKTFACKVYEQPVKAPGAPATAKMTVYVNADVPGGVVRADGPGPGGTTVSLTLTAADPK